MLYDKGVAEFAEAAKIAKAKFPDARFQLLGPVDTGNPAAVSKSDLDSWKKFGVEYLGETDDVLPYVHDADVAVLPSYREGLPKSLIEAMAAGKPAIASDIAGCRAVVRDGENGFLVPVKNSDALADAMISMIEIGNDARKKMGERGRTMVMQRFDEKIILQKYSELARKILGFA